MMGGMRAIQFVDRYPVSSSGMSYNRVTGIYMERGVGDSSQCHLFISPQSTSYVKICTEVGERNLTWARMRV